MQKSQMLSHTTEFQASCHFFFVLCSTTPMTSKVNYITETISWFFLYGITTGESLSLSLPLYSHDVFGKDVRISFEPSMDRNCQFSSIVEQLYLLDENSQWNADSLRTNVVKYIGDVTRNPNDDIKTAGLQTCSCRIFCNTLTFRSTSVIWTRKASCSWQTRATLAKRLHGLCKSIGVVSCVASLPIDSLPMVSYYHPIVTVCLKCIVFEIWWHIDRKSLKNPHLARSFGVTTCEFFDDSYLARLVGAYARGPAYSWVHCQHV